MQNYNNLGVYTVTRKQYDVHGHFVYHILAETTSSVDFRYTAMTMAPFTARAIGSQMDSRDTLRVSYHASPCVKTFFYCLFRNCLLPRTHKPNAPQTTSASALSDWITMHLGGLLHVYLVSDRPRHILKPSVNRVHMSFTHRHLQYIFLESHGLLERKQTKDPKWEWLKVTFIKCHVSSSTEVLRSHSNTSEQGRKIFQTENVNTCSQKIVFELV